MLDELSISNSKTLEIVIGYIDSPDSDPDILMRAIHAMPVISGSAQQMENIISKLARLSAKHPSESVRSSSLFKISTWAKDAQDLEAVIQALDKRRPPDDRISAVMAISQSNVTDDSLRDTLVSRMMDTEELWEIRRYSAEALERFKLDDNDYKLYMKFKLEQADIQSE